ncbi:hypothetical protein [Caulobacter flavus]|nr:hypothetical protein [Caulobacter flavus]
MSRASGPQQTQAGWLIDSARSTAVRAADGQDVMAPSGVASHR